MSTSTMCRTIPKNKVEVTTANASEYNDNYTVLDSSGGVVSMEHNESEARKYIAWYRNRHGMKVAVRENPKDVVRRAQALCPNIQRHPCRKDIIYA